MARTVDCNGIARHISRGNILVATDNIFFPYLQLSIAKKERKRRGKKRRKGAEKTSKTHGGTHSVATALSEEQKCDREWRLREYGEGLSEPYWQGENLPFRTHPATL